MCGWLFKIVDLQLIDVDICGHWVVYNILLCENEQ
jgi:hypothetical protein